jgi:hypothetical protein
MLKAHQVEWFLMDKVLSIFRRSAVVIIWSAMAVFGTAQANDNWTPKQKAEFALQMQALAAQEIRQGEICNWLRFRAWESLEYAKGMDDKKKYDDAQTELNDTAKYAIIINGLCQGK